MQLIIQQAGPIVIVILGILILIASLRRWMESFIL
jgi:hypothetical protein